MVQVDSERGTPTDLELEVLEYFKFKLKPIVGTIECILEETPVRNKWPHLTPTN